MTTTPSRTELTPDRVIADEALLWRGHFETASGQHTDAYWRKFLLLARPERLAAACTPLAGQARRRGADTVVGPTLGGVVVAYEVARQAGIRAVAAERGRDTTRFFRDGAPTIAGARVYVVDDVLMTGGTLQRVLEAVSDAAAEIVGAGVLLDRNPETPNLGRGVDVVHRLVLPEYAPDECPMCAGGEPLTRVGGTT